MTHILHVDSDKCTGHGRCYVVAPGLLSDDEQGFAAQRGTDIEVTDVTLEQAKAAVNACPEGAISLREQ